MITFEQARQKMLDYLAALEADAKELADLRNDLTEKEREILGFGQDDEPYELAICDDMTITGDFGWVFYYQSRDDFETEDGKKSLVGNAPIIISKADGSLHVTGTAHAIEFYIENFRKCGDPLG